MNSWFIGGQKDFFNLPLIYSNGLTSDVLKKKYIVDICEHTKEGKVHT